MKNIVTTCVSNCQMKVNWNGEPTEYFSISRGIRQADPLSPYLFVLCVERLSQLIDYVVNSNIWKPIQLNKKGPKLSLFFFADDLVLFAKASLE